MKQRFFALDNLKAFLIFCVVFGHMVNLLFARTDDPYCINQFVYFFIYAFHMPAFVFLSGFFYSKGIRRIIRFGLYFLVFQFVYSLFDCILFEKNIRIQFVSPYWSLWYLCTLFWYTIVSPAFIMLSAKIKPVVFSLCICISLLAGFLDDIGPRYSLSRTIVFFPYYLVGLWFSEDKDILADYCRKNSNKALGVLAIVVAITFLVFYFDSIEFFMLYGLNSYSAGYGPFERLIIYLIAAVWILGLLLLFISKINKYIPLISDIGRNTLWIYLLHGFVVKPLHKFEVISSIGEAFFISVLLVICIGYSFGRVKVKR